MRVCVAYFTFFKWCSCRHAATYCRCKVDAISISLLLFL